VIDQVRRLRTNTVQLVDAFPEEGYGELRQGLPGVKIVQVVHVRSEASLEEARQLAPFVDGILLDSGNPELAVKELGGTGRIHDWDISRRICASAGRPVFLAGGLKPENVAEAVRKVGPFGVDVCSGVRTGGVLDETKLAAFAAAIRPASA
jgi:phosphoribosylanthranilate isomerase